MSNKLPGDAGAAGGHEYPRLTELCSRERDTDEIIIHSKDPQRPRTSIHDHKNGVPPNPRAVCALCIPSAFLLMGFAAALSPECYFFQGCPPHRFIPLTFH